MTTDVKLTKVQVDFILKAANFRGILYDFDISDFEFKKSYRITKIALLKELRNLMKALVRGESENELG